MKNSILNTTVLLLIFVSCGKVKNDVESDTKKDFEKNITEKYWKLKTLNGKEVKMEEDQEREVYFILKTDKNELTGFGGCNDLMGVYELKPNNRIEFSSRAGTLKSCPYLNYDEREFLQVFEVAKQYDLKQDSLILKNELGDALATFEAIYF
ncbi:MAG TPA: META domain-containing protein [Flavobacteriaceae bacterium]|nr:META domain-containing protein [Flavobacteriaceae bacterium]